MDLVHVPQGNISESQWGRAEQTFFTVHGGRTSTLTQHSGRDRRNVTWRVSRGARGRRVPPVGLLRLTKVKGGSGFGRVLLPGLGLSHVHPARTHNTTRLRGQVEQTHIKHCVCVNVTRTDRHASLR